MTKDSSGMYYNFSSLLGQHQKSDNYVRRSFDLDNFFRQYPTVLELLLIDHTTHKNILWATENYSDKGDGFQYHDHISIEKITGENNNLIIPRAFKTKEQQQKRSKEMAEVFTPSWICNKQNNLIDNAWFGRDGIFNNEEDYPDGRHSWEISKSPVIFPSGRTWSDYVNENRLEITCGEAPYLANLYDAVTGQYIPIEYRTGLLDRKLRIVSENTSTTGEWLKAVQVAYKSVYAFEWQGDNLLIARLNLLRTFIENYCTKFNKDPQIKSLQFIAYIISWNLWQMDGLKGVIPNSCGERRTVVYDLFGETETISQCEGCKSGDIKKHNGTYALIKNWSAPKEKQKIRFIDLIK